MDRRLTWLLALLAIAPVLGAPPTMAASEPPPGRQWTREFALVDLATPFFEFWDGTQEFAVADRVASFRAYFEPKHVKLLDAGVFSGLSRGTFYDHTLPAYTRSLVLDPLRLEAIKLRRIRLQQSIPLYANRLQTAFEPGELRLDRPFVLGLGFGVSGTRVVSYGDRPTLYVPVDAAPSEPLEIELASGMYRLLRADLKGPETSRGLGFRAFEEGAARLFAVEQFPGFSEQEALGYGEADWRKAQRHRPELVRAVLQRFEATDGDVLARFDAPEPEGLVYPPRAAAYVGFLAMQRLRRTHGWDQIIRWDEDTIRARMNQALSVL